MELPKFQRRELGEEILSYIRRKRTRDMLMFWGARQSGKSTLVQQVLKTYDGPSQYLNIDKYSNSKALEQLGDKLSNVPRDLWLEAWLIFHWDRARELAGPPGKPFVLVLDEIQRYPQWASRVKGEWDQDRWDGHRVLVILLGSSPRHLQRGIRESLCGRCFSLASPHWTYPEMSEAFGLSLDEYIFYGGYPGSMEHLKEKGHTAWAGYIKADIVSNNLERDVIDLIDIERPKVLEELYELGAFYSGQLLSFDAISQRLQRGSHALLPRYLDILSKVYMLTGLRRFSTRRTDHGGTVKFQVLSNALLSVAQGFTFEEKGPRIMGAVCGERRGGSFDEYKIL